MPKPTRKITADDVLNWHGSEHGIEEMAEILADVANGDYKPKLLKEEIAEYNAE
jgi:hypothetical protein